MANTHTTPWMDNRILVVEMEHTFAGMIVNNTPLWSSVHCRLVVKLKIPCHGNKQVARSLLFFFTPVCMGRLTCSMWSIWPWEQNMSKWNHMNQLWWETHCILARVLTVDNGKSSATRESWKEAVFYQGKKHCRDLKTSSNRKNMCCYG